MSESEKFIMITGSAGGIGRACISRFFRQGWRVIGIDKTNFGEGFPQNGLFIRADISKPDQFPVIYRKIKAFTPVLHALVNNAAVQVSKPLVETTVDEWDMVIATNLRPVFLSARFFHEMLVNACESAIVNISSVHAVQTSTNISAYAASKGGILAITRAMAIEFANEGIRVNAVLPGAVDTPMLRDGLNRGQHSGSSVLDRLDNLARKTVNGRIGQPDEIAQAVYFLADCSQSSFMTGQALIVDGGATARLSTE